ncbi:MAG: hypothetical protein ABIJ40_02660 [Bacteroidota bacterium]
MRITEKLVIIRYDLNGAPDEDYEVSLVMKSKTDSKIEHTPKFISGDIGEGKFYGRDRQIVWNFDQEFGGGLDNDDLFIEITAEEVGWGFWGYSWRGGIATAIGAAAYILLTGKTDQPTGGSIPQPTARPGGE